MLDTNNITIYVPIYNNVIILNIVLLGIDCSIIIFIIYMNTTILLIVAIDSSIYLNTLSISFILYSLI